MRDNILEVIEISKLRKPSIYTAEIQNRLLLEGICTLDDLPSIDAIEQKFTKKNWYDMKKNYEYSNGILG